MERRGDFAIAVTLLVTAYIFLAVIAVVTVCVGALGVLAVT